VNRILKKNNFFFSLLLVFMQMPTIQRVAPVKLWGSVMHCGFNHYFLETTWMGSAKYGISDSGKKR